MTRVFVGPDSLQREEIFSHLVEVYNSTLVKKLSHEIASNVYFLYYRWLYYCIFITVTVMCFLSGMATSSSFFPHSDLANSTSVFTEHYVNRIKMYVTMALGLVILTLLIIERTLDPNTIACRHKMSSIQFDELGCNIRLFIGRTQPDESELIDVFSVDIQAQIFKCSSKAPNVSQYMRTEASHKFVSMKKGPLIKIRESIR